MNYLSVENLTKSFGEKLLFENITFGINAGQKVALIARNGAGKSSLLNIIMGIDIPESGRVVLRKDLQIAYLPQTPFFEAEKSVIDIILASNNAFIMATKEYEESILAVNKKDRPETHARLDRAMAQMDVLNAWDFENKVKEVLSRLNIVDVEQKIGTLSGGQLRKVALAKILIDEVDFLIMDEPTNHLDIGMIEWLEDFLNQRKLSLMIVTHDRYFLDNVCDEIYELEQFAVYQYKGDYAYYIEKKTEREAMERVEVEKAKNIYRTELEWMRRMPKARTHKSKSRIDAFSDLELKAKRRFDENLPEFKVKVSRIGNKILELNSIHKSFSESKKIIENFSYTFKKGERIGVVGPNGIGKSTLFKMIMGEEKPGQGHIIRGQTMVFGYFSQQNPPVKDGMRVIDLVKEVADEIPFGTSSSLSASQFLTYFNFDHTAQHNYYSNLSGGEKRRLHLCLTMVHNPNFLILDEPTNDLDIPTLNILEDFLMRFEGCLLVATHDRAFLDKLVDHIFVFEGDGKIKDFYSNYSAYRLQKMKEEQIVKKEIQDSKEKREKPKQDIVKATYKQIKEYEQLTEEISLLETEKNNIEEILSSSSVDAIQLHSASIRFGEIKSLLDEKELRWLELSEIVN